MGQKHTSRYCSHCGEARLAIGPTPNHVLHLILTLLTAGIWAIVWLIVAIATVGSFRCTQCGSKV